MKTTAHSFSATTLQGKNTDLSIYKGKTLLVVNTASKCGLTPQYEGLENLYQKYKDKGLVVMGFPCNQFANQEPGDEKSISENCLINYGVTFPMFAKVNVNGKTTHPLFRFLKDSLPGHFCKGIKWNFTKFLVDADGKPLKRFAPYVKPATIDAYLSRYFV